MLMVEMTLFVAWVMWLPLLRFCGLGSDFLFSTRNCGFARLLAQAGRANEVYLAMKLSYCVDVDSILFMTTIIEVLVFYDFVLQEHIEAVKL